MYVPNPIRPYLTSRFTVQLFVRRTYKSCSGKRFRRHNKERTGYLLFVPCLRLCAQQFVSHLLCRSHLLLAFDVSLLKPGAGLTYQLVMFSLRPWRWVPRCDVARIPTHRRRLNAVAERETCMAHPLCSVAQVKHVQPATPWTGHNVEDLLRGHGSSGFRRTSGLPLPDLNHLLRRG